MTKHTPTWHATELSNIHDQGLIIDDVTGENIAVTYKQENAHIIVNAVNNHEALLEACKEVLNSCLEQGIAKDEKTGEYFPEFKALTQAINQATKGGE